MIPLYLLSFLNIVTLLFSNSKTSTIFPSAGDTRLFPAGIERSGFRRKTTFQYRYRNTKINPATRPMINKMFIRIRSIGYGPSGSTGCVVVTTVVSGIVVVVVVVVGLVVVGLVVVVRGLVVVVTLGRVVVVAPFHELFDP